MSTGLTTPTANGDFDLSAFYPNAGAGGLPDVADEYMMDDYEAWKMTMGSTTAAAAPGTITTPLNAQTHNALVAMLATPDSAAPAGKRARATSSASSQASTVTTSTGSGRKDKKSLNKAAAERYRRKKRQQFDQLQEQSATLTAENTRLSKRCSRLEMEVGHLKELLMAVVRQSTSPSAVAAAIGVEGAQQQAAPAPPAAAQQQDDKPEPVLEKMLGQLAAEQQAATDARIHALEQRLAGLQ